MLTRLPPAIGALVALTELRVNLNRQVARSPPFHSLFRSAASVSPTFDF
jgi:hypothetical protein